MKRNKGFTILELIAIILVIALVLAISIPTVTGIIESTRRKAFGESAKLLVNSAVNLGADENRIDLSEITASNIKEKLGVKNTNYSYVEMTKENETNAVLLSLLIGKGQWDGLKACGTYRDMTVIDLNNQESCPSDDYTPNVELTGKICGWEELEAGFSLENILEAYDNNSICYISSIDDLVAVSKLVNQERKSFENKTVLMVNNIDINNTATYYAEDSIYFGDVNNDGVIETLYQEMTTGKGFRPIGTSITNFQGTFEGNIKTISNLYINRPDQSGVALIGHLGNNGKIRGIILDNANVIGNDLTALLVGFNYGIITDSIIHGSISGTTQPYENSVGIVTGYNITGIVDGVLIKKSDSILDSGLNITGRDEIGYGTAIKSIVEDPDLIGRESMPNDVNFYEYGLDTWIGGDNNSDGYYFDYSVSGEMTLRKVVDYPMVFNLSGSGTIEDPYLINNYNDWKTAALRPSSGYVFKLNGNIDFNEKKYYQLGSYYNPFNGTLEGNAKTLSNINIEGYDYSGIIGYSNGNIKGLTVNTSNIVGLKYTGGLVGYQSSGASIKDVILNANVSGIGRYSYSNYGYVGGVVGYNYYGNVLSVLMKGNVTGINQYTGGLIGYNLGTYQGIYSEGSMVGGRYTGPSAGYSSSISGYYSKGISISRTSYGEGTTMNGYGTDVNNNINTFENALDTWIGGDNNSSGYYFDYNNSNNIVIKSVLDYPMTFNLSGSGTESDPYLINSVNDWKTAALRPNNGYHFKLTSDVDFYEQNFYQLGSTANPFNGIFNGDARFLKNIVNRGIHQTAIFGYNNGTIKALNIENLNQISEFNTAGIAGYNSGIVRDINLQGTISSSHTFTSNNFGIGGIVGSNNSSVTPQVRQVLVNANISGYAYVGGLVGRDGSGIIEGIMEAGSVLEQIGLSGRTIGRIGDPFTGQYVTASSSGVTKSGATINNKYTNDGTVFDESNYNNLTSYNGYGLDTRIGGDNDSSGYYFDYNSNKNDIIVKSLEREPILNIYADAEEIEINYGDSAPITNYFNTEYYLHPTHNPSLLITTCRLERNNTIITNINQIPLGRERVSCILSYTNEYGTTSSEPASTIFYHKLHIYANNADKVIDYGTATAIQNDFNNPYYSNPSSPLPGFSTVCRREKDSSSIGNTNQLPLGIDKVQCKLVFTNEYGTTNSEEAATTYKHQLYLSPKELQFSINYGQDSLISSYYNYNPELTGSDIVCKLGETVITNTNQLTTYGGNQVTCNRTYTNEYGSHSGPNSSILFTHYPPTIAAKATPTSVRYNFNNAILNYYDVDNKGYPNFTYTCRRARDNGVVTNINELARGINVVTCTISDENVPNYSTAHTEFKHWYYPSNSTYSCPSGYALSYDDPDETGEPVCRAINPDNPVDACREEHFGSDTVPIGWDNCYLREEYSQALIDLRAMNAEHDAESWWRNTTDGGTYGETAGAESYSESSSFCEDGEGYFYANVWMCMEWIRGPDPTSSGGTCNYNGTNDSGATISPTLSSGRCYFD